MKIIILWKQLKRLFKKIDMFMRPDKCTYEIMNKQVDTFNN